MALNTCNLEKHQKTPLFFIHNIVYNSKGRHMPKSVRVMIKYLRQNGFIEVRQNGSHKHFKNYRTGKSVAVPYHTGGKELGIGLERAILKQAGLDE